MQLNLRKLQERTLKNHLEVIKIDTVLPLPIFSFDLTYQIDADELVSKIYKFKEKYPVSMKSYLGDQTNVNAWHSDYITHKMTDILDDLIKIKIEKIKQVYTGREYNVLTHNSWINIYQKNDYVNRHYHSFHGFSTVYYPYVEENPTSIIFDDNGKKPKRLEIIPKKNMLLVFHSAVFHKVPKVTENTRISISCNFDLQHIDNRDPTIYQNQNEK